MLKAKPCSEEGCNAPSWSKGKCRVHGNNTTSLQKAPLKKGKSINRQSEKYKAGKEDRIENGRKMIELFDKIWSERPHYCFETGAYLGEECLTTMMHHCLYKGIDKYKIYALEEWNIVIIHPDVHNLTHANIDKTPKIKAYTEQLLKQIEDGEIF